MKSAICRIVMVLTTCICMLSSAMAESELPAGYKAIVFSEKDPVEWRHEDKSMYLRVEADFNGDGVIDEARILRSEDDARIALFCFLKDKDGNFTTFRLKEFDDPKFDYSSGDKEEKAGNIPHGCWKGIWIRDLNKGEPKSIELKNSAVNLFSNEGSSQYFYWDESIKDFKNVWISD